MLPQSVIDYLQTQGVTALWSRVAGVLEVEAPAFIAHVNVLGRCSFGAFSYSDYSLDLQDCDIGRYCSIASGVKINPGRHPIDYLSTHPLVMGDASACGLGDNAVLQSFKSTMVSRPSSGRTRSPRVAVGHDVWIGANVILMQGVTIGHGAIIGAGSIVTRDVEPFDIVAGAPARPIRRRFPIKLAERILQSAWWDRDLSRMAERDFSQPEAFLDELERADPPMFAPAVLVIDGADPHRTLPAELLPVAEQGAGEIPGSAPPARGRENEATPAAKPKASPKRSKSHTARKRSQPSPPEEPGD